MSAKTIAPAVTRRALRFGVAGVVATGLHVLIAMTLIRTVLPAPSIANGVAFAMATIFSYLINTMWSFGRPLHGRNLLRFFTVSGIGLVLAMIISGVAQHYGVHYMWGIFFVVLIVPPVTFLLHSFWTYR
jgi:putative flippase GtrA